MLKINKYVISNPKISLDLKKYPKTNLLGIGYILKSQGVLMVLYEMFR